MGQLVDEIKPQFEAKMNFVVVFVDNSKEQPVADKYNVQFVPMTFLFNNKGAEAKNYNGAVPKDELVAQIQTLVK
jgi:thioredoxin-like negative regulator of GroEL